MEKGEIVDDYLCSHIYVVFFFIIWQEAEQEIEAIREDIARVKERGRQIMETSDPEGYQAMQATLTMLTDKIENLQAMADDKAKQLQVSKILYREKHNVCFKMIDLPFITQF